MVLQSLATHHESTRTAFETPWGKFRNLLGMMLTTDLTLLPLSAVDNDIFAYFFMSQVWTMKLTESINICYDSVRVFRTIKLNIKETFMGNDGSLKIFVLWLDCSQRIKDLLLDKFSIFSGKDVFLLLWETHEPILSRVDIVKFGNPSSFDLWNFWLLVTICGMPRGL